MPTPAPKLRCPAIPAIGLALFAAGCSARTVPPQPPTAAVGQVPAEPRGVSSDLPSEASAEGRGVPSDEEGALTGLAESGGATGIRPDTARRLPTLAEISPMPAGYGLQDGRGLWTPVGPDAAEKMRRIRQILDGPGGAEWAIANGMPEEELAKYRQWLGQPLDLFDPSRHRELAGAAEAFARRNPSQRPVRRPWCFIHYHGYGIMIPYPCPRGGHPGGRD